MNYVRCFLKLSVLLYLQCSSYMTRNDQNITAVIPDGQSNIHLLLLFSKSNAGFVVFDNVLS